MSPSPVPACALGALLLLGAATAAAAGSGKLAYPKPPLSDQVDDYHGTKVPDPYRRLEDPDAPATRAWIDAENRLTQEFLGAVPQREAIRRRLTTLIDYERYSPPFRRAARYFYQKNDGLQNQAVLYVTEGLKGTPRALLDPNGLSKDGTVALAGMEVSRDGKWLAYGLATAGSDWNVWKVRSVDTGKDLEDRLEWVKFSGAAFLHDGSGFYYSRYDAPAPGKELEAVNKDQKLFFHKVGTTQGEDVLVYARPDEPEFGFGAEVSEDGRWLVVHVSKGTDRRNRLYVRDLATPGSPMVRLFDGFDASYAFVGNVGSTFFVTTDRDAPRKRVVVVDVAGLPEKGGHPALREVVPQGEGVLSGVALVGDRLVLQVMKDASEVVRLHRLDGTFEKEIALPTLGTVSGFSGERTDRETFYAFTSFTYPTTIFRFDFDRGTSEVLRRPKVAFDPASFETERVFYESKDGTKVPMFLVRKKGLAKGTLPTHLYGYGGFNIPMTPGFSSSRIAWLEMGGLYAQPCLRGGSEYGEEWHRAGMLDRKQNTFDDFAAAAGWLVKEGWTTAKRIGIAGGSNGGLLVGATLNQHPELFGAAVPMVGVMDMLRFHRFTIGWAWVSDYGSADDPKQFPWLYAYSPLQNVKKGAHYPPVMVMTADHDDRVVPAHSFKYTAALQAAQGGDAPILIRIETKAGHGAGTPVAKQIEETADMYAFFFRTLGGLHAPAASVPAPASAAPNAAR